MAGPQDSKIKVAPEVWIATALLHREHPDRQSFKVGEIVDRTAQEGLCRPLRPGVQVHASLHCVANKRPNPSMHRMLYETLDGGRRLFRDGDDAHPYRSGKIVPDREEIPAAYWPLLDWYAEEYNRRGVAAGGSTPGEMEDGSL
jgi:hypothetical protein